jgi:hypothetical protein
MMKKIKFIVCYFGEWPVWLDGFLLSCKYNEDIDWLFFTDCKIPNNYPPNVEFVKYSIKEFNDLASSKLDLDVNVPHAYKFCDFKVTYGCVFQDYLDGYDFWGMCDIDVIFGDIKNFVTDDMLDDYDIISSRKEAMSGHFSLFKNNYKINNIFREIDHHNEILQREKCGWLDEQGLTIFLKQHKDKYKISWNTWLINFPPEVSAKRKYGPSLLCPDDGPWHWNKGKLFIDSMEVMYLHFMTWKDSIKNINFNYEDDAGSFYISHVGLDIENDKPKT